jgi:hypothetical protein
MNSVPEETYYFLLSATRKALIGEIQSCFRGIAVKWLGKTAELFFYIDGEISERLQDDCSSIGSEVVANFSYAKIDEHIVRVDYPLLLPKHKYWAFRRYEDVKMEYVSSQEYQGLILSSLYCLLGSVRPEMRGIALENQATLLFYCNGPIDHFSHVCAEIGEKIQKMNPGVHVKQKLIRLDYPTTLPRHDLNWIFLRKE